MISEEDFGKIRELQQVKEALVESLLNVDDNINEVQVSSDYINLVFNEGQNITTDLIVKLSRVIFFYGFSISVRVRNRSWLSVVDYSTVELVLRLDLKKEDMEE